VRSFPHPCGAPSSFMWSNPVRSGWQAPPHPEANSVSHITISSNASRPRLAQRSPAQYHKDVDPTTFFVPLFMFQQLAWTPPRIHNVCAKTYDPPACYDEWQATRNISDAIMMGNWKRPTHTPGSFYNYIDPVPLPSTSPSLCNDRQKAIDACY